MGGFVGVRVNVGGAHSSKLVLTKHGEWRAERALNRNIKITQKVKKERGKKGN